MAMLSGWTISRATGTGVCAGVGEPLQRRT